MPLYVVVRDCSSGVTGQLVEGQIVDLDENTAEWLNGLEDGPAVKAAPKKTEPPARPGA